MGQVTAFVSGKGGTGKSALCAAVSTALAQSRRRVLCVDMDVGLRNLDIYLGISQADALSFSDICRGSYSLQAAYCHPQFPSLHFLTAPANGSFGQISAEAFRRFLDRSRPEFDDILLDGPSGHGIGMELLSTNADLCVLPTLPDPASIRCAERTGQELEKLDAKNVRLLVNRSYNDLMKAMDMNIDDIMDAVGLPLLGIVPSDPNVSMAAARGRPLLLYSRFGAAAACKRIAQRIQGQSVPISR